MVRDAGTIPALAGKPRTRIPTDQPDRDYPRARGETTGPAAGIAGRTGLSPRSRGNRRRRSPFRFRIGTIPALAGKPRSALASSRTKGDYPRARGETVAAMSLQPPFPGLSPRSRGNLQPGGCAVGKSGTIPALAGKPCSCARTATNGRDYPRARGETVVDRAEVVWCQGLSPRSRGNQARYPRRRLPMGTIPALAGKPSAIGR